MLNADSTVTDLLQPMNMRGSGQDVVMSSTIFAIIGAIALQKGGDVAAQYARERVLLPLGIL